MARARITITLNEDQLREVRSLVADGNASSVSAFVKHAVAVAIQDVNAWKETLDEALEETGGPITDEERRWADSILTSTAERQKQPLLQLNEVYASGMTSEEKRLITGMKAKARKAARRA